MPSLSTVCGCFLIAIYIQSSSSQNVIAVETLSTPTTGAANVNSDYATLSWIISKDTVTFSLHTTAKAWFAIGYANGMINADMALIEVQDNNTATVTDLWSLGFYRPMVDSQQDYTVLNQTVTDNSIDISFSRKLDTGDVNQDSVLVVGTPYTWEFSYGVTTQMIGQHSQQGLYNVNFGIDGVATSSTSTVNA